MTDDDSGDDTDRLPVERRHILVGGGVLAVGLAGCYAATNDLPAGGNGGRDASVETTTVGYGGTTTAETTTVRTTGATTQTTADATTATSTAGTTSGSQTTSDQTADDYGVLGYGEFGYGGVSP